SYVDATPANTVLQGGIPLVSGSNYTTGSNAGAMDNLWHLRTGAGNGGDGVWTADEGDSGSEDVVPLGTTNSFPGAGGYQVYAYIWTSDDAGQDWSIRLRLGDAGIYSKVSASEAEPASPARFDSPIVTSENARHLVQIPLGVVTVPAAGTAHI